MAHPAFSRTDHRPWPCPTGPWAMAMSWQDLLFAHWSLPGAVVRALVPPCLEIDLFEGRAWVAVVPFRMSGVRPRFTPALPGPGAFPELNLRTYVRIGERPGVFFWSLDAASRVAVRAARAGFHLPYFDADMSCTAARDVVAKECRGDIEYTSHRTHAGAPSADLVVRYGPSGEVFHAARGTLEHWLTERYCLYAVDPRGRALRGEIHHARWALQPAHAEFHVNTIAAAAGLQFPDVAPHLLFARRIDVVAWLPASA